MDLREIFSKLKQTTNSITSNPLLNLFEDEDLVMIDDQSKTDMFIYEKNRNIQKLVRNLNVDFDSKLKSAFDEYSEAITYIKLKEKFPLADRIKETRTKTPDFKIQFQEEGYGNKKEFTVFAELKTLNFSQGDLNYKESMNTALDAQIDIEKQLKQGNKIGFGISYIQPLYNSNKKYDPYSRKFAIETLIDKIDQNIKEGQFEMGETMLFLDLKQLALPGNYIETNTPIHKEKMNSSYVSGICWNTAFGRRGHLLFRPIEFEGTKNTDKELEMNGILVRYPFIKAIVFFHYEQEDIKRTSGLHRYGESSEGIISFLNRFCDFVNDDHNTNGFKSKE